MTKKLQLYLLASLPSVGVFLLALFFIVPKQIYFFGAVMPMIHLVLVFISTIMHPKDISPVALAAIGLIVDVATGLPMALSALCYCMFGFLVRSQRKYIHKEGFAAMWGYFALWFGAMQCLSYVLAALYTQAFPPSLSAVMQWSVTVLLYPPLHWIFFPWLEKMTHARYRLLHG